MPRPNDFSGRSDIQHYDKARADNEKRYNQELTDLTHKYNMLKQDIQKLRGQAVGDSAKLLELDELEKKYDDKYAQDKANLYTEYHPSGNRSIDKIENEQKRQEAANEVSTQGSGEKQRTVSVDDKNTSSESDNAMNGIFDSLGDYFRSMNKSDAPGASNLRNQAKMHDIQAGEEQANAQQSQQIANRDYRGEAEKNAVASAATQNAQTVANLGNVSAGAAALERTVGTPDYNTHMNRQDEQREKAVEKQREAWGARQTAEEERQAAEAENNDKSNMDMYNSLARYLSMGAGGNNTDTAEQGATSINPTPESTNPTPESTNPVPEGTNPQPEDTNPTPEDTGSTPEGTGTTLEGTSPVPVGGKVTRGKATDKIATESEPDVGGEHDINNAKAYSSDELMASKEQNLEQSRQVNEDMSKAFTEQGIMVPAANGTNFPGMMDDYNPYTGEVTSGYTREKQETAADNLINAAADGNMYDYALNLGDAEIGKYAMDAANNYINDPSEKNTYGAAYTELSNALQDFKKDPERAMKSVTNAINFCKDTDIGGELKAALDALYDEQSDKYNDMDAFYNAIGDAYKKVRVLFTQCLAAEQQDENNQILTEFTDRVQGAKEAASNVDTSATNGHGKPLASIKGAAKLASGIDNTTDADLANYSRDELLAMVRSLSSGNGAREYSKQINRLNTEIGKWAKGSDGKWYYKPDVENGAAYSFVSTQPVPDIDIYKVSGNGVTMGNGSGGVPNISSLVSQPEEQKTPVPQPGTADYSTHSTWNDIYNSSTDDEKRAMNILRAQNPAAADRYERIMSNKYDYYTDGLAQARADLSAITGDKGVMELMGNFPNFKKQLHAVDDDIKSMNSVVLLHVSTKLHLLGSQLKRVMMLISSLLNVCPRAYPVWTTIACIRQVST